MPKPKPPKCLTKAEERFVEVLAQSNNMTQACEVANISRKTGYSWKIRPEIAKAIADLEEAKRETRIRVVEEYQATRTKVVLTEIDDKLKTSAGRAVEVLIEIMEGGKRDADRIAACDRIIKLAGITEQQVISHGSERSTSTKGLSQKVAASIWEALGVKTENSEAGESDEEKAPPEPETALLSSGEVIEIDAIPM
jgi:phage terminase small subunit